MQKKLIRSFGTLPKKTNQPTISCCDIYIKFKPGISKIEIRKNLKKIKSNAYNNDLFVFAKTIIGNLRSISKKYNNEKIDI